MSKKATYQDQIEEFGHYGRHTTEEGGPGGAFHVLGKTSHFNEGADLFIDILCDAMGVHITDLRHQDDQAATDICSGFTLAQLLKIMVQRAWVRRQVFMWGKLRWVHKDRHDRIVVGLQRSIDQLQMTFMQRSHRRDKADSLIRMQYSPTPRSEHLRIFKRPYRHAGHVRREAVGGHDDGRTART